jgi:hypothetical protein
MQVSRSFYVVLYTESRGKQTYAKTAIVHSLTEIRNQVEPTKEELTALHSHLLSQARPRKDQTIEVDEVSGSDSEDNTTTTSRPTTTAATAKKRRNTSKGSPRKAFAGAGPMSEGTAAKFASALSHGTRGLHSKYRRMLNLVVSERFAKEGDLVFFFA